MAFMLPPRIVGPVSVLSTHVDVNGANNGASVSLRVNGAPVAANSAGADGRVTIPLGNATLNPGDLLTAIQSLGPDTSDESRTSEPVLGFPSSLSPLIFLSEVHRCADSILVGGTCINSAITVTLDGAVVGKGRGNGGTVNVGLAGPLPETHVLVATQTANWHGQSATSPPVKSLPIQPSPVREQPPPIYIVPPLWECDSAVMVSGVLDGATVVLESNAGGHSEYEFQGNTAALYTGPLHQSEIVTATQVFRGCNMKGRPSAATPVTKPTSFPPPSMPATLCRDAPSVTIWNLQPGAVLSIYIGRNDSESLLGTPSVATAIQTFDLPSPIVSHPDGPWQYLKCFQNRCDIGGPDSNKAQFLDAPTAPRAPSIGRLTECATTINLAFLTAGASLRLSSDDPNTPVLSAAYSVIADTMDIPLYRGLRAGETVTAVLIGCGAGPDAQAKRQVDRLSNLRPPTIHDLIRTWMHEVYVTDCVPGAQVHIFVNGMWRNQATAHFEWVRIGVGVLAVEDKITVQQCMCTAISDPSTPASVVPGDLVLVQVPSTIVRGPSPVPVTILAGDSDDRHVVAGLLNLPGGVSAPTNSPFSWVFPVGQPDPPASVSARGYATKTVTWVLKDPVAPSTPAPPVAPPAPTLTLDLQSMATNPPVKAIKAVQWEILRSAGSTPAVIGSPNGPTASLPLPKPTPPATFEYYFVGCTVTLSTNYGDKTVSGVDDAFTTLPYHAMIEWRGISATAHFLLVGTPVVDDQGNVTDYLVEIKFEGI
jgi:hypothetical protein